MEIPDGLIEQVKQQESIKLQEEFGDTLDTLSEKEKAKILEYKNLNFGDIIIAKRYATEEEKNNIPQGHEIGPFMVASIDEGIVKCFYISSKEKLLYRDIYNTIPLNVGYNLTTSNKKTDISYVKTNETCSISLDMFKYKVGQLSKKELLKFKGIIEKYKDKKIEVYDIVIYGKKKYLVHSEENDHFKLYLLRKCCTHSSIQINDEFYELVNSQIIMAKNANVTFIGKAPIEKIIEGSIIEYYNHLYYVYSVTNTTLYGVYVHQINVPKAQKIADDWIKKDDKLYKINWPTIINISSDDNYKIVSTNTNIENVESIISRVKKKYKQHKHGFCIGKKWVVQNKYTSELYLIINKVVDDKFYLIPYIDFIRGIHDNIICDDINNYEADFIIADKLYKESSKKLGDKVKEKRMMFQNKEQL